MIKKISTILSLVLLISISSTMGVFADAKPKRELIEGSIPEISTELNKRAFKDSKEVILVNEDSIVDSISATPLAYAKNAPIVVTKSKNLGRVTRNYLKELGPEKVTIVGGLKAVSKDAERNIEKMGMKVERIRGKDRYDTSLKIAREMYRTVGFDEAFLLSSTTGLENAISVYSYAAKSGMPIIWAKDEGFEEQIDFLKGKNLKKIYALGDSKEFIAEIDSNLKNIEGIKQINKSSTNVDLIKKFYDEKDIKKIYTAKLDFGSRSDVNEYISLGVVSAKENMPILICSDNLSRAQDKFLKDSNINDVVEVGYTVGDYSLFKSIFNLTFLSCIVLILLLLLITFRALRYESK
ncbi:cell wall binding protein [Clostridioides difficile]|uniref:cell wall-binding protein Cwp7 n=1 Tax=Clostridioides difficile TaxID=1496 RepID=UPI000D1DF99D|nr:cell wall-binding protein Cwp7 [Clostridioides difficile]EGT2203215.1 cell wall-binding protein Cwp7 [Clostridioides difficile]EGT4666142.1 cell wall-binding protein Cwp7 [Clostridioides difficile]UUC41481.1 cell wall-binding protein Cwp7 [Clostridioides difficile]UWD41724.1 cell wall-binding protein Cwp7 [Clostridioides difficile]UWD45364.1 cell wall-binding protein Cwp7 [Clostridioides difficile]